MNSLLDSMVANIVDQIKPICKQLETLPVIERVEALNKIRLALHDVSPFKDPIDCVLWVKGENVTKNDYNPNTVAPPEMRSLKLSILKDHYTQPIVTCPTKDNKYIAPKLNPDTYEVVDGAHRFRVGKENKAINKRSYGYLPVTAILPDRNGRANKIAATIRHNRARGVHGVRPMTNIVVELIKLGWTDDKIAKELGMDADEVLRFKHTSGLAELFKNHEYSKAWE